MTSQNFFIALIANPIWYLWGFALAFGDSGANTNPFVGNTYFALSNLQGSRYTYAFVFYQWTFQSAASTIISGAMAERTRFSAYVGLVCIISGWIYPVVVHWQWSSVGWLSIFRQYALTSVTYVHSVSAVCVVKWVLVLWLGSL
jgi:Amt family ammonium transporter